MNSQQRRKAMRLQANIAAQEFKASPCGDSRVEWLDAAASDGSKPKPKKFGGTAYSGGLLHANLPYPTVVDIEGIDTSSAVVSLLDHNASSRVGHVTAVDKGANRKVKIAGEISASGEAAQMVANDAQSGFPWQFSIAGPITKQEFVRAGEKVNVNGRSFTGPIIVARQMLLREVSFVAIGADASTSASFAASLSKGSGNMEFSAWLAAKGIDEATLTAPLNSTLRAGYDAEIAAKQQPNKPDSFKASASGEVVSMQEVKGLTDTVKQLQAMIAEQKRVADINALPNVPNELKASAIKDGKSVNDVCLDFVQNARPSGPGIHVASKEVSGNILEAAICTSLGHDDVEKRFGPEVLEASHKQFKGRIGLQQIILVAAAANGYHVTAGERLSNSTLREALRACFLRADLSTVSLPGILGNVANKEILAGYMEEDQTWQEISRVANVSDFKQATSYRLLDSMEYEQLAPSGKISHGTTGEESYTRQAKTYAKMYALDRTTIINDDLGALDDLRTRLGKGASKKFNNVFWAKFMDNSTFFTTARTNYLAGATTNLGLDGVGLTLGVKTFRMMTSPAADGSKRVTGRPTILLVPPELEANADILYTSRNLDSVKASDGNIHANKYRPVVVPWLSDANFTGNSSTAWYMFRNPSDMAPMVVSFLNGVRVPTVESTDADFDMLGIQFRGYHDFGCDQAEYLSGAKFKGAA